MSKIFAGNGSVLSLDNPEVLARWYYEYLDVDILDESWMSEGCLTVAPPTPCEESIYWGAILKLYVSDLDFRIARLCDDETSVVLQRHKVGSIQFAHVLDPEGNVLELWDRAAMVAQIAP